MIRRGTYVLAVSFSGPRTIRVGAIGEHFFQPGTYLYAGSAMNGLDQRLNRHLSKSKKVRWHIDYLTTVCDGSEAYESYPEPISECDLAKLVEKCGGIPEMDGFGCSDCDCRTHLFRASDDVLDRVVASAFLAPFVSTQLL